MKLKELLARAFFYTKLGWGNYISWELGAIAYITIIYELVLKFILPASYITYLVIFFGLMILAFFMGMFMSRKGVYGVEHKINTETNPYINIPIGSKEILNYQSQIAALKREIQNYEIQKAICEALNLKEKIPILEQNIESAEEYRAKMEDMLNKAVI
jgi:hypothetical protein